MAKKHFAVLSHCILKDCFSSMRSLRLPKEEFSSVSQIQKEGLGRKEGIFAVLQSYVVALDSNNDIKAKI